MRPAELHSWSAEKDCMTENVSSLRSVKVAPPCAAKAAIPCGVTASKFESEELNFMEQTNRDFTEYCSNIFVEREVHS